MSALLSRMKKLTLLNLILPAALLTLPLRADVKLPAVISDHMVLQADSPVSLWGWADAHDAVSVTFAGQTVKTTADAQGAWTIKLDKLKASSESQTLSVQGRNTVTV